MYFYKYRYELRILKILSFNEFGENVKYLYGYFVFKLKNRLKRNSYLLQLNIHFS